MRKFFGILALCLMGSFVFAQQYKDGEDKPAMENPQEQTAITALQTAYALADYGYANSSASALIEAAEIIAKYNLQQMEASKSGDSVQEKSSESSKSRYTAEQLITDGKKMAGSNKTLTKWANEVDKAIKKLASSSSRGNLYSPQYDADFLGSGGRMRYNLTFVGGYLGEVLVNSLSGCDFDLYIYDSNGNLCVSDASYSTSAYVSFVPRWTGTFQVVVRNSSSRGGSYELYTN